MLNKQGGAHLVWPPSVSHWSDLAQAGPPVPSMPCSRYVQHFCLCTTLRNYHRIDLFFMLVYMYIICVQPMCILSAMQTMQCNYKLIFAEHLAYSCLQLYHALNTFEFIKVQSYGCVLYFAHCCRAQLKPRLKPDTSLSGIGNKSRERISCHTF